MSNEPSLLAHTHDPDTSHEAAAEAVLQPVKHAILWMLARGGEFPIDDGGMTAFELQAEYVEDREARGWPLCQPFSVNRRASELKRDGFVYDTGRRLPTPDNRRAAVLAITEKGRAAL